MIDQVLRILKRRSFYRSVFNSSPAANEVLADLRRFAKIGEPQLVIGRDGQTDVYATGMLAGRQEAFWRIASHLHLDDAQLLKFKESVDDNP